MRASTVVDLVALSTGKGTPKATDGAERRCEDKVESVTFCTFARLHPLTPLSRALAAVDGVRIELVSSGKLAAEHFEAFGG